MITIHQTAGFSPPSGFRKGKPLTAHHSIEKSLHKWKEISGLDFALLTPQGKESVNTGARKLPASQKLKEFLEQPAVSKAVRDLHYFKVYQQDSVIYVLLVWGKDISAHTIGELAVCQIEELSEAYRQRLDKNTYMQNLLLGNYSSLDAFNWAKKLHIPHQCPRAILLVQTKQPRDENALAMVKNLFTARTGHSVTSTDDSRIVVIKELSPGETPNSLENTARTLVDMLNTEAMTQAWVGYSSIADDLSQLPGAYQEAQTALTVGKIFYSAHNTFGYNRLGIGNLIYQLSLPVCEKFIAEVFRGETLDTLDEETFTIIRSFFENNLNLSETARQLYVHRNTLVYRFEKIQKKYGLDLRTFQDALTFQLAIFVSDYLKYQKSLL